MEGSIVTKLLCLFHLISQLLLTASYLRNILYHTKKCNFLNKDTFTQTSSVQDLAVILK